MASFPFLQKLQTSLADFFRPEQGRNPVAEVSDFVPSTPRTPSIADTIRGLMTSRQNNPQAQAQELMPASTPTPTPQPSGTFARATHYQPTGNPTSTGTIPQPGRTAAVSPDMLDQVPYGTLVLMPDGIIYRVEDRTADDLTGTIDIFGEQPLVDQFPYGKSENVPFTIIGKDTEGLKYNYRK